MAEETFIGLRRALAKLFSRELADRPLEDIINGSIAKKRAKFKLSHEDIQTFCIGIGDNNPIHRSGRYAKLILGDQIEKETIVAPGTQLTALAEAYIDDAIEAMQDAWGVILNFTGLNIKFKDWVFPDEPVYWQVLGYRETSRGTNLKIGGLRRVGKDETPKIVIEAMLAKDNNGRSMTQAGPLWTNHYFITNEKLRFFYPSVGETIAPMIPWSYPISFVTSSLLDKAMDNDGVPTGINREMQFDFYKKPDLGKISVDFFSAEEPKELRGGLGFKYTFNTTISQNHEPLISGQVVALSKKQIVY